MAKKFGYKKSESANGTYSVHLNKRVSEKLANYCSLKGVNRTTYLNGALDALLDKELKELMMSLTKEDLVRILLDSKSTQMGISDLED